MLAWLFERFDAAGDGPALIHRGREYSYGWLGERVAAWERELRARGAGPGSVVALEGDYSPEACALLLALIRLGAVTVPLTPSVEASKPRFLRIAEAQWTVRLDRKDGFEMRPLGGQVENPLTRQFIERGHPGLVLFSSGSTGEPKAALHDFCRLLEKFRVARPAFRTLAFLLLDHIGGINTLLYGLANTGTVVSVEERSPAAVCAAIERHGVELLPTSPTFLNLLILSEAYRQHDLGSLKRITYGTEPMPESTLRRLRELFPWVDFQQTYGLSELGILRSRSREPGSLWVRVGGEGFETKVVDGLLWIRARSAMVGYLNAPSPFDAEGWFNTGDEVLVDGEWLRILGRRSELINVGGEKVYPAEVESVLLELPNVRDVTVTGEPNPVTGNVVTARFVLAAPEELASLRRRMREHCRARLAPFKIPVRVEIAAEATHGARFKKLRRAP